MLEVKRLYVECAMQGGAIFYPFIKNVYMKRRKRCFLWLIYYFAIFLLFFIVEEIQNKILMFRYECIIYYVVAIMFLNFAFLSKVWIENE